jgi:hypothetical protein
LTYAELLAKTKAGGLLSRGYVYHALGLIDCGNPEVWLGLVKRSAKSEADKERVYQLVSAMMADYVFALKFDEIVFNPYTGGDAGNLTPIEHIMREFGKDVPAPVSIDDFTRPDAEAATGEAPPSPDAAGPREAPSA